MNDRVHDSADAAFFETRRAGHDRRSQVEGSQAHCFALDFRSTQRAQPAQARCRERTQDAAPVGRDDDHLGLLAEQIPTATETIVRPNRNAGLPSASFTDILTRAGRTQRTAGWRCAPARRLPQTPATGIP